jgi:hypothetical protein
VLSTAIAFEIQFMDGMGIRSGSYVKESVQEFEPPILAKKD